MEVLREMEILPGFRLRSVTGEFISPYDYKEKQNLVIFFFDTSCEQCGDFLKDAADRYGEYLEADTEILVVGNAPVSDLADISDGLGLPFPILSDPESIVLDEFSNGIPTVVVADRFGEIRMVTRLEGDRHSFDQDKVLTQLQLIELECPECGV